MNKFSIESLANRGTVFAVFVVLVLISSLFDLISEFNDGEQLVEMIDDVLMFVLGAVILTLLCVDYFRQKKALRELKLKLEAVSGRLDENDRLIGDQFREVMQKQFEAWQLTPAEQEVALSLIKGLSFREVAELRQTREKTARQHAANVYRKSGLSGRHELAGWFFEDLFNPVSPDVSGTSI